MKNLFPEPPGIVRPAKNLAELAVEIKTAHYACEHGMKTTIEKGGKAGELLLQAKEQAGLNNWEKWVADNLPFSLRTAQVYMKLARGAASAPPIESLKILASEGDAETDQEGSKNDENSEGNPPPPASAGQRGTAPPATPKPPPQRSGLWGSAPKG